MRTHTGSGHGLLRFLCGGLLGILTVFAAQAKTCGDVAEDWGRRFEPRFGPAIGHFGGTETNSKQVYSDATRKQAYLQCSRKTSLDFPPPQTDAPSSSDAQFKQRVSTAAREQPRTELVLRRAIYLRALGAKRPIGGAEQDRRWALEQENVWCTVDGFKADTAVVPANLPSLIDGISQLDPLAIQLAWTIVETWPVDALGDGCDAATRVLAGHP